VAAALHAGREPRPSTISAEGLTVKQIYNHGLTYQHRRSQAGGDPRRTRLRIAECGLRI